MPFGCSDGREYWGSSECELGGVRELGWNESARPVEGGDVGGRVADFSDTSFWNTSRNGDWRRGESRPRLSETYLGEPEWLESIDATDDLLCGDSTKTEGSNANAGFIDCRLAARDIGGCREPFRPLEAFMESFINTWRGRTPSSRLVRRPQSSGRGTVSP